MLLRGVRLHACGFVTIAVMALKPSDKAPGFTLPDENEQPVSLSDFAGRNVVLFFFPKANTPG